MSHVSKLKAAITDLVCLETAADSIGMEFDRHATQFRNYGGRMTKCEGKLSVRGNKDAYEMGVEKNKDGTYGLLWDSYSLMTFHDDAFGSYIWTDLAADGFYVLERDRPAAPFTPRG